MDIRLDRATLDYQGKPLRVGLKDGKPWFALHDLCAILGIYGGDRPRPDNALARLAPEDYTKLPCAIGPGSRVVAVTAEGVRKVAERADRDRAAALCRWIDTGVPEAIRRAHAAMVADEAARLRARAAALEASLA